MKMKPMYSRYLDQCQLNLADSCMPWRPIGSEPASGRRNLLSHVVINRKATVLWCPCRSLNTRVVRGASAFWRAGRDGAIYLHSVINCAPVEVRVRGFSTDVARGVAAMASVLLAAAVSVVVNIWSSSWEWPAGTGLAVLVAVQGWLEFRRAAEHQAKRVNTDVDVDQRVRETVNSDVTAVRGTGHGRKITVRQRLGRVEGGSVTGVEGKRDD
jgi:hypothetical protein